MRVGIYVCLILEKRNVNSELNKKQIHMYCGLTIFFCFLYNKKGSHSFKCQHA